MAGLVYSVGRRKIGDSSNLCILFRNAAFINCRSLSSIEAAERREKKEYLREWKNSFTVSYLVRSCGLSQESAKTRSQFVQFSSSDNPDSVIKLLRNYGFDEVQVTKIISSFPRVLLLDPEKILSPKLKFFGLIGFSKDEATNYIASSPKLLSCSLQNKLIPCHNFLKNLLNRDEDILKCVKRSRWIFAADLETIIACKVSILRDLGVSQSSIQWLFTHSPRILSCAPKRFDEILEKIMGVGFDPKKFSFLKAVITCCQLRQSSWERKVVVLKSCGWSEDDISSAFKKHPCYMESSEQKIVGLMDFLVKKIGLLPTEVAKYPRIFCLSLEKRIIPRCLRIGTLLSKGLLKAEGVNYFAIIRLSEAQFLERFVIKYQNYIPQLLSVAEDKTVPEEKTVPGDLEELQTKPYLYKTRLSSTSM